MHALLARLACVDEGGGLLLASLIGDQRKKPAPDAETSWTRQWSADRTTNDSSVFAVCSWLFVFVFSSRKQPKFSSFVRSCVHHITAHNRFPDFQIMADISEEVPVAAQDEQPIAADATAATAEDAAEGADADVEAAVEEEDADPDVSQNPDDYLSDGEEDHEEDFVYPEDVPKDTSCLMIIDGLPKVPEDKIEKLSAMLRAKVLPHKKVNSSGETIKVAPVNFTMPFGEKTTQGFAIVEYASPKQTKAQIAKLNGFSKYKLNLRAFSYGDVRMLCSVPDELPRKNVEDHPE